MVTTIPSPVAISGVIAPKKFVINVAKEEPSIPPKASIPNLAIASPIRIPTENPTIPAPTPAIALANTLGSTLKAASNPAMVTTIPNPA